MNLDEVMNKLQDNARELSSLENWFNGNNQKRLSEYISVCRLINFKVQELLRSTPQNELNNAIMVLFADLYSNMEYNKDNQLTGIAELYGAAIDGLKRIENLIKAYLP